MFTLKVQVISSRVVAGDSSKNGRPYRFIECECNVLLGTDVRGAKFNLPRAMLQEPLKPGPFELDCGAYVNSKGQLAFGIDKVRTAAAVRAAA